MEGQILELLSLEKITDLDINEVNNRINNCVDLIIQIINNSNDNVKLYYDILNITGYDLSVPIKEKLLSNVINLSPKIRMIIWDKSIFEIKESLNETLMINNMDLCDKFRSLLLGESFLLNGIGSNHDWKKFVSLMEPYIKNKIDSIPSENLIFWSKIDLTKIDSKYAHIENTTLGNKMYFLDLVYSNWSGETEQLPKLAELWDLLSVTYTRLVLEKFKNEGKNDISYFCSPSENREFIGDIFVNIELPLIIEYGISQITLLKIANGNIDDIAKMDTSQLIINNPTISNNRINQERKALLTNEIMQKLGGKHNGL